ncbi:hypothetical protein CAEBREN_32747 [Caenorhabditis brenneri]|uniref:Uncharacterized protein n=1 Tax=Caenorhabditis brenneri TaxID=135651 RepID=G0MHN2_CAEBE|nr:hypothetical protein CAEBREN_32747 [Caenorhabditis brenneri]
MNKNLWALCTTKYEKVLFILAIFFAIITGLIQPFESYTLGEVAQVLVTITNAINNKTIEPSDLEKAYSTFEHDMNRVVIYFLFCGFAYFTSAFLQFSLVRFVGDNTTYRVRKQFIECLLRKDICYFDSHSTGHFSALLNDNLERFREVFNEKLTLTLAFFTDFAIGTTLAFYTDWQLASYGFVFALGIAFSGVLGSKANMKATEKQNIHYNKAASIVFQTLGSYKTVCSLNGQPIELEKYSKELLAGERYGVQKKFWNSITEGVNYFCSNALNTVILYFGANMIYKGSLQPSVVIRVFHFMLFGSYCLSEAIPNFSRISSAISSIAPIAEILIESNETSKEEVIDNEDDAVTNGKISFKNVQFSYPSRPEVKILKGVTFDVNIGECVAFVGASGSGKSTVIQLLLRYYNIDAGRISIDGVDLSHINLEALRSIIGVVSQEPVLFDATIEENIRFGNPNADLTEIYEALKQANAYDFVIAFPKGIKTIVGERGTQLSGGQKQRIAIARTLASKGRTTIVIAHRLSTIRNATKIIVMDRGQIVEVGNHEELIAKKCAYYNLVQTQLANYDVPSSNSLLARKNSTAEVSPKPEFDLIDGTENDLDIKNDEMERLLHELHQEGARKSNLREILKWCSPDCMLLTVAILGSSIQGMLYPVAAQLIIRTYESFALERERLLSNSHFWALSILGLAFLRPLVLHCQVYYFGKVSEKLSTRLRTQSFKHLLNLQCSFFDDPKHSPTRLSNRLNTDSSNVKAAVDERLGSVIMTFVAILIAVTTSLVYCWKMTLQVLLLCPFLYLAEYCYETAIDSAIEDDALAFENSNRVAIEALENIRTVRSLTMEKQVMSLITESLRKSHESYFKRAIIQGSASGLASSCYFFIYAISFKFGTYLSLQKEVMPMDTYLVLMTLSLTSTIAGSATAYLPDYKKAVHAAGLIFNLFTYPATMIYDSKDGKKNIEKGGIKGENLHFHYAQRPDKTVLNGVNLKLDPGKTLALVGPSGCGKSTVLSLLERFYHTTNGELKIDDENVEDINLMHLRSNLALVSQEPVLFNCSIRENLLYGLGKSVSEQEIKNALQTANAYNFVNQFPQGLDTIVGERGTQLSGGQKQRIAIARAVLRKPKILLLDEATSALDSESEKLVQSSLDNVSKSLTTIIVAHRLSTIVHANSIAVLANGKVVEQGTHCELLAKKGHYYQMLNNHRD